MGARGPIEKRDDQVIRRNADRIPADKVPAIGDVPIPELDIPNPHKIVVDMYESLKTSAQNIYFEDSDWQYARFTLHFCNKLLRKREPSAMMLATVNQMLTSLLMTEGDRRRVRIEIERNKNQPAGKVFDVADMFRQRLNEQPPSP